MTGVSLNITAVMLIFVGSLINYGSNTWMLIKGELPSHRVVTVSASNIVAMFSMSIGVFLTQVEIYNNKKRLKKLEGQELQTEIGLNIEV